jgi:hypothetical protein
MMFVLAALVVLFAVVAAALSLVTRDRGELPKKVKRPFHLDLPEVRAAIHEAGHAVTAWRCTAVGEIEFVRVGGGEGLVRFSFSPRRSVACDWCRVVIALAGPAAEAMTYASGRSLESRSDLTSALRFAESLAGTRPPWKVPEGKTFDFEKLFHPRPPEAVLLVLCDAYRTARRIVRGDRRGVHVVASALLSKKKISHRDLEVALGPRYGTILLMPFGPRFVMPLEEKETV